MMEFMTGVKEKETVDLTAVTAEGMEGKTVKIEGTVHTIRDMGEVAFVILRRADGLLQCVFEEGVTAFDLKTLKEASSIVAEGTIHKEERAPHGVELRLTGITVLSEPAAPMPLAHRQMEAEYIPGRQAEPQIHFPPECERAGQVPDSGGRGKSLPRFPLQPGLHRNSHPEDRSQGSRGRF